MTTTQKIRTLTQNDEDFEWYPTTEEILSAMNRDLHHLFEKGGIANDTRRGHREKLFDYSWNSDSKTHKGKYLWQAKTFLDVGAGDGRVYDAIKGVTGDITIGKRYAIEKAKTQADDLINRDVFIIGRDFFKTSLIDKTYSVIFSNPPYSVFKPWTEKLLNEANFGVMYLVLPVRWEITLWNCSALKLYEIKTLGEFDFFHADRTARARVNLIRLNHKTVKVGDCYQGKSLGSHIEYGEANEPDSFDRWIDEHIGGFRKDDPKLEEQKEVKLKQGTIADLVENYDYDMKVLLEAFKAFGKMPGRVLEALNMDRPSVLEIIRENIKTLKNRYWRIAFDKLSVINSRLVRKTRERLLYEMEEFQTLDFNEDNIYSIIVWVIKHFNEYTDEQILSVFDALTSQDYIKAYKSNVHWTKDNWRYTKEQGKPEKYLLDYRLVTRCYKSYRYDSSTVDDFIVICRSLGFHISEHRYHDYEAFGEEQCFYTDDSRLAFTVRQYKNHNAHMKINRELMMRFNIEVAKLRKWVNNHRDIVEEFEVSEAEAAKLWNNSSLLHIGQNDITLLEYKHGT